MLPIGLMIIIKLYLTKAGRSPFEKWFTGLDHTQAIQVTNALDKLANNKPVATKSLSNGLKEIKISSGGGLRVYFCEDGDEIILLLGGGRKDSQSRDVELARDRRADYLERREPDDGR